MANTMIDLLVDQLSGDALGQLSGQLGVDEGQARQAMVVALPLLLTALQRNASDAEGATALAGALERDHDGSLLEHVGRYVQRADTQPGDAILRHVLGARRPVVERGVSRASGLDRDAVHQLLALLAPLVLAYLGRQKQQQGLDPAALAGLLTKERVEVEQRAPQATGGLASILDADGDGDLSDDLTRMGTDLLGQLLSGRG